MITKNDVKNYYRLCAEVSKHDKNASVYMLGDAQCLESFIFTGSLSGIFCWSDTPQGLEYWRALDWRVEHG